MKIYERQVDELSDMRALEFERKLHAFVCEEIAVDESLVDRLEIRRLIAEALELGFDTERQTAAYVVGVWTYGRAFANGAELMRERLTAPDLAPEDRARLLLELYDAYGVEHEAAARG